MRRHPAATVGILCAVVALALPAGASAGRSATSGSDGAAGPVLSAPGEMLDAGTGGVPFTGVDLALIAGGGASLIGLGAGMRRMARARA